MDQLSRVGTVSDNLSEEVVTNYNILSPIVASSELKSNLNQFIAQISRRVSKKSILANEQLFWKNVVQGTSQAFQNASGEIFRCCVCRVLDRLHIPYELDASRPEVSSESIDIVVYPNTYHEFYIELKKSCRERPGQLISVYSGNKSAYFVTEGKDLTQKQVNELRKHGIISVPLVNIPRKRKKVLTNVVTFQSLIDLMSLYSKPRV